MVNDDEISNGVFSSSGFVSAKETNQDSAHMRSEKSKNIGGSAFNFLEEEKSVGSVKKSFKKLSS
jgi:hypothetical protein